MLSGGHPQYNHRLSTFWSGLEEGIRRGSPVGFPGWLLKTPCVLVDRGNIAELTYSPTWGWEPGQTSESANFNIKYLHPPSFLPLFQSWLLCSRGFHNTPMFGWVVNWSIQGLPIPSISKPVFLWIINFACPVFWVRLVLFACLPISMSTTPAQQNIGCKIYKYFILFQGNIVLKDRQMVCVYSSTRKQLQPLFKIKRPHLV